jgi:hypothetical protein
VQLIESPKVDPCWGNTHHPDSGRVIAEGGGCRWLAVKMSFTNWRLIGALSQIEESHPVYGWCFNGQLALMAAVALWDPETEDEPLGWHKRAGSPRRARQRHLAPEHNRPRCIHGSYFANGRCAVTEFCEEFRERRR